MFWGYHHFLETPIWKTFICSVLILGEENSDIYARRNSCRTRFIDDLVCKEVEQGVRQAPTMKMFGVGVVVWGQDVNETSNIHKWLALSEELPKGLTRIHSPWCKWWPTEWRLHQPENINMWDRPCQEECLSSPDARKEAFLFQWNPDVES